MNQKNLTTPTFCFRGALCVCPPFHHVSAPWLHSGTRDDAGCDARKYCTFLHTQNFECVGKVRFSPTNASTYRWIACSRMHLPFTHLLTCFSKNRKITITEADFDRAPSDFMTEQTKSMRTFFYLDGSLDQFEDNPHGWTLTCMDTLQYLVEKFDVRKKEMYSSLALAIGTGHLNGVDFLSTIFPKSPLPPNFLISDFVRLAKKRCVYKFGWQLRGQDAQGKTFSFENDKPLTETHSRAQLRAMSFSMVMDYWTQPDAPLQAVVQDNVSKKVVEEALPKAPPAAVVPEAPSSEEDEEEPSPPAPVISKKRPQPPKQEDNDDDDDDDVDDEIDKVASNYFFRDTKCTIDYFRLCTVKNQTVRICGKTVFFWLLSPTHKIETKSLADLANVPEQFVHDGKHVFRIEFHSETSALLNAWILYCSQHLRGKGNHRIFDPTLNAILFLLACSYDLEMLNDTISVANNCLLSPLTEKALHSFGETNFDKVKHAVRNTNKAIPLIGKPTAAEEEEAQPSATKRLRAILDF